MSKIVILILSHRIDATRGLLQLLDERFSIYLHIDARIDLDATPLHPPSHARVIDQRHTIFWGGFNMVRATRDLIMAARSDNRDAQRYVLISGDALPSVHLDVIEQRLLDLSKEFIDLVPVERDPSLRHLSHAEALERHRWLQPWRFQNHTYWDDALCCPRTAPEAAEAFDLGPIAVRRIRASVHRITQDILRTLPPRPNLFDTFYFGSQWWALSAEAVELIVPDLFEPAVERFFEFLEVSDEHFFHCLIGKRMPYLDGARKTAVGTMMFTDHDDPVRGNFGDDALSVEWFRTAFAKTGRLFARKFNPARAPEVASAIADGTYFGGIVPAR